MHIYGNQNKENTRLEYLFERGGGLGVDSYTPRRALSTYEVNKTAGEIRMAVYQQSDQRRKGTQKGREVKGKRQILFREHAHLVIV